MIADPSPAGFTGRFGEIHSGWRHHLTDSTFSSLIVINGTARPRICRKQAPNLYLTMKTF
jgi:hypothetical protein